MLESALKQKKERMNSHSKKGNTFRHLIMDCLAFIFLGLMPSCRPPSSQISTENRDQQTLIQANIVPKLALRAIPAKTESVQLSSIKKEVTPSPPIKQKFTPSDRMWGHLLLPAQAVGRLHESLQNLKNKNDDFSVVLYGDSHTQGGFIGEALGQTIVDELQLEQKIISPGFVSLAHPIQTEAKVNSTGIWLRQNWLYSSDQGSFGPLGIAFATQDRTASMRLNIGEHQGVQVTAYFERTGQELPFCLNVLQKSSALSEDLSKPASNETAQQVCHQPTPLAENDEKLGKLTIVLNQEESLSLNLKKGAHISPQILRKREKFGRILKRKRARLRKRYPRLKRSEINKKIKRPSYAKKPHLLLPNKPYLQFLGFEVKHLNSPVTINSMGVRGATVWSPHTQGDETIDQWIGLKQPKLLALWFGTNTAAREGGSLEVYKRRYQEFLQRIKKASPRAACLVILPPDFGRRDRNCFLTKTQRRLLKRKSKRQSFLESLSNTRHQRVCDPDQLINTRKRGRHRFPVPEVKNDQQWETYKAQCQYRAPLYLEDIINVQKEVALTEGCAVYDTYNAMGGQGGIQTWACAETERWAQYDLVHLSQTGYRALGARIAQGLLSVLDEAPVNPQPLAPPILEKSQDHLEEMTQSISPIK